jgi:hypothetical protein
MAEMPMIARLARRIAISPSSAKARRITALRLGWTLGGGVPKVLVSGSEEF